MIFEKFSKQVFYSFNPKKFHKLTKAPFWDGVRYLTKVLIIAYIIMLILFIPKLVSLKSEIQSELSKFDTFLISGKVTQIEPINIPKEEPLIVIDARDKEITPGKEKITITRDSLFYKFFFSRKEVSLDHIKQMETPIVSRLLIYFLIFILPSIIFFSFAAIWIKYFLALILIGTAVFLTGELTRFGRSWKTAVKSTCYASTIIIPVELISSAIYSKWMLPLISFWGLTIYIVPLVAWAILSLAFVSCLHFKSKK